ncbi:hypothetical protein ACSS4C_002787 [Cronobacter sakazakii]|nr:hypothetical protein [Cronobacter sakazakii]MDI7682316.1 hypothetical protein [Cronobacter sakazakii]MDK1238943.1 hypothetical protein [Cronobacter sakazakii]
MGLRPNENRILAAPEMTPGQSWDAFVNLSLPKVLVSTPERMEEMKRDRTEQALHLAAAALRAAGEFTLAENLLN